MNNLKIWQWAGMLAAAVVLAGPVRADTIKLKDGTVLEGDILSEDANTLTIKAMFANGTIEQIRTEAKKDIASVTRSTSEEKAARDAQRDYREVTKYALDPNTSKALAEYDRVINDTFRGFLTRHPNSAYQRDVEQRIAQWQAERDQVAAGKTRYQGQWLSADEAAFRQIHNHATQTIQRAKDLVAGQKFSQAITELKSLPTANLSPNLEASRQQALREASGSWIVSLEAKSQELDQENRHLETRLQATGESLHRAQTNLSRFKKEANMLDISSRAMLSQYESAVHSAQNEMVRVEGLLNMNREQQTLTRQELNTLRGPVATSVSSTPIQTTPPAGSRDLMDQLDDMLRWGKDHWLLLIGGVLVAMWLVSHLMR